MARRSVEERVEILEQTVGSLETLPEKVTELTTKVDTLTTEFSQFRTDNDEAHSATRTYLGQMHELAVAQAVTFHDELKADIGDLRSEMVRRFDAVDTRFGKVDNQFKRIDERFNHLEAQLNQVLGRLPAPRKPRPRSK